MSPFAKRFGTLVFLILSGCATWPQQQDPQEAQLERWLSEQRYGPALQVLERRAAEGDQVARERLDEVRALAADYDRTNGDQIQRLAEAGDWDRAERALEQAQEQFPEGKQIQYAARQLTDARRARAERVESELLLARTAWLKRSEPLWRELAELDPYDLEASWHLRDTERQLQATGERLGQLGLHALSRGDYQRAEQLLGAATPLAPSEEFSRALAQISEQQSKVREAKQGRARQREELMRQQTVESLSSRISSELASGDLSKAEELIAELQSLDDAGKAAARPFQQKLQDALVERVEQLNASAEELYGTGQASAAQETWQEARRALARLEHHKLGADQLERLQEGLQETIIRRVQALVREGDRLYAAGLSNAARQTWKEARVVLDQLQTLYPSQPQVVQLKQDLEDTIAGRVQILIKQGDDLYAAGQIAEARQLWGEATQLAPQNPELASRLERADKVLERLKELKNGESAANSPAK